MYLSGLMATNQAAAQERARIRRHVQSVEAVISKALWAVDNIASGVFLTAVGEVPRSPQSTLQTVLEAMTPMRILELAEYALVDMALEIKSDVHELLVWLLQNQQGLTLENNRLKLPDTLGVRISRARTGCEQFIDYAQKHYRGL